MVMFNYWQVNLIFFLIFAVIYFQFYKLAIRFAKNDGAAVILLQLATAFFSLFFIPFFPVSFPTGKETYILLFLACIFYALYDRLQGTARKHIEVSVYSIVNQLNNVFVILMGLIVFREPLVGTKIIGAFFIIFGNILVFYEKKKLQVNYYIYISVIAAILFAVAYSIDIGISKKFNLPFYIMLTTIIPGLFIFFAQRIKLKDVIEEAGKKKLKYYIITGAAWFLSYFFSLRAYKFGQVTTVAPLQATAVMLNVLVAYFFLKEKQNIFKKCTAAFLVIIGITITILS